MFGTSLFLFALARTGAIASPPALNWNPDETMPTGGAIHAAAARARAEQCGSPSCRAIEAIDGLLAIQAYMDDHEEMGTARLLYSPVVIRRRLGRVLLDHPSLYAPFCSTSAQLLGRLSTDPDERAVAIVLLVEGVDVDLRDGGRCAERMVTALPNTPDASSIRKDAETICESPSEVEQRPKAACERALSSSARDSSARR